MIAEETTQRILFEPHAKQQEFIDALFSFKYRVLLYGGAAGGGKTFVSLAAFILLARIYPGSKWFVVRESLPTLKRTTIPSFLKLCPRAFIRSYNQTDQVVTFTNGSQMLFFPENYYQDKHLTRFDGIEANGFLIEEGQECQESTFNKCLLRAGRHILTDTITPKPLILITCNPNQGFTKRLFHDPFVKGTLQDDYFYLRATMADNPSLTEEYLEGLENLDDVTREIFVRGNWSITGIDKPFAYSFNQNKNVAKGLTFDRSEPTIVSFDFNVDPITAIVGQSYEDKIRILKEYRLRNSDIYELCSRIREDFGENYLIVTGDASGSARSALTRGSSTYYTIIKQELDLSRGQIKVPKANPSIRNNRVLLNSLLAKHGDFVIDSGCNFLIEDLQFVEVTDSGDIDKAKDARRSHLLDCLRYYVNTFHFDFVKYLK